MPFLPFLIKFHKWHCSGEYTNDFYNPVFDLILTTFNNSKKRKIKTRPEYFIPNC